MIHKEKKKKREWASDTAQHLRQAIPDQMELYAGDVTGAVLPCGHWVAEESPELLLKHLLPFLG